MTFWKDTSLGDQGLGRLEINIWRIPGYTSFSPVVSLFVWLFFSFFSNPFVSPVFGSFRSLKGMGEMISRSNCINWFDLMFYRYHMVVVYTCVIHI